MKHLSEIELGSLRAERHRLSNERARLLWLRRLLLARRDLEVARLTGATTGLWGTDSVPPIVRAALVDGVTGDLALPTPDLLASLAQSLRTLDIAMGGAQRDLDAATLELVRRYRRCPELCLTSTSYPLLADASR